MGQEGEEKGKKKVKLTESMLKRMIRMVIGEDELLQKVKEVLFAELVEQDAASDDPEMGHSADGVLLTKVKHGSDDYKNFGEKGLLARVRGKDVSIIDPNEPPAKGDKFYVGEF